MKKKSNLQELMGYAGEHRYLTYLPLLLSAVSAVLALFPFVFLFRIIQEVTSVAPDYAQATHIVHTGWMAVGFALLSICGLCVCLKPLVGMYHGASFQSGSGMKARHAE